MRRVAVFVVALVFVGTPAAAWQSLGRGTGKVGSKSMPAGNTPSATASVGQHVAVSWTASTFAGGGAVPGYVVKRYDLLGNPQTVGAACAGTVSGTSCTEDAVPLGSWQYTVTAAAGTWRGIESAKSTAVAVIP